MKSQNIELILLKDGKSQILVDDKPVRWKNSWSITTDGKFIALGNLQSVSNLIEIVQITDNQMIIELPNGTKSSVEFETGLDLVPTQQEGEKEEYQSK